MSQRYVVVKAKNINEALAECPFFIGQKAHVSVIRPVCNQDGTFTLFAEFELDEWKVPVEHENPVVVVAKDDSDGLSDPFQ